MECWDGETLETIANHLGVLLKIDELTTTLVRSKFARVCIEIDLSKPLSRGFWIGDDHHRVFVVVMYERLPTFCYKCGLIGHGSNSCNRPASDETGGHVLPFRDKQQQVVGPSQVPPDVDQPMESNDTHESDPLPMSDPHDPFQTPPETDYGPWLLVSRRRGRSRGRGGITRASYVTARAAADTGPNVDAPRGTVSRNIRGGSRGTGRGRFISSNATIASPHATNVTPQATHIIQSTDASTNPHHLNLTVDIPTPTISLGGVSSPHASLPPDPPQSNRSFL